MQIGPYRLTTPLALAPMAGVTDRPFRLLCRRLGAGIAPSEMVTADTRLWHTPKSRRRLDHEGEPEPRVVQIAGGDPEMLADAARLNVDRGAQIIDINMGCPAKKVCNKQAGSALLRDEGLVQRILEAAQDPHRLQSDAAQRRCNRKSCRGERRAGARSARAHARMHVSRRCGVRNDLRDKKRRANSDFCERRY
jgi:tRNA-dihydrouridine synthase B